MKQQLSISAILVTVLIMPGVVKAQSNTAYGSGALSSNTTGNFNTASGFFGHYIPIPRAITTQPVVLLLYILIQPAIITQPVVISLCISIPPEITTPPVVLLLYISIPPALIIQPTVIGH